MADSDKPVPTRDELRAKLFRFIDAAIDKANGMLGHDPGGAQACMEAARSAEMLGHDLVAHGLDG